MQTSDKENDSKGNLFGVKLVENGRLLLIFESLEQVQYYLCMRYRKMESTAFFPKIDDLFSLIPILVEQCVLF